MDFNTRYLASGYVAKSYPFGLFETKGGAYMYIDYIYTTYHKEWQSASNAWFDVIVQHPARKRTFYQDDWDRVAVAAPLPCPATCNGCVETPPQPLSNYQQEQSQTYHTNPTPSKQPLGHIMHWWTHSDKLTHSESWPGLKCSKDGMIVAQLQVALSWASRAWHEQLHWV